MSSASRIVGASAGSRRRACDGRSRSTGRPSSRRNAARRSSASASSRSRATTSVPDRAVARVVELGAEVRVAARALQPELQQRALAELGLGDRREHARGDVPGAGLAGVDARRRARRAAPPATRRRGRSRHRRRRRRRSSLTALALRLRPPYAGTTRIRFDGRRPGGALSARLRAPVFWRSWYPLMGDATRAPRHRPPVPRLPRPPAGRGSRRRARRRRPDPAARQDARRRRRSSRPRRRSAATTRSSSSTTGRTWSRRAAPTACTSARTTTRPRRRARAVGPDRIVGRSTHAPDQAAAADADPDVDYLAVGPVHATPTKPGRPAAGLHYVAHAASTVGKPWFAIGGLDAGNVHEVVERGATPDRRRARDHRGRRPRGGGARAARALEGASAPDAEPRARGDAVRRSAARGSTSRLRALAGQDRGDPGASSSRSARTSGRSASSSRSRSRSSSPPPTWSARPPAPAASRPRSASPSRC